ncbi:hypothetical protein HPB50_009843 [Hyalomma asiaticum]|uniref:Uncharacterized protein n=1 Tax=Hyalomma asiaticum TaxID=266040 RepID=A0ACB7RZI2_HYAAI|nr:hypothetical protein HPB50_009843 [Hyalomma asiaticum]
MENRCRPPVQAKTSSLRAALESVPQLSSRVHCCCRTVHGLCYSSPKKWPPLISVVAERVDDGSLELSIWRMNTAVQCVSFSKWAILALPQLPVLQGCLWHPERDVFCLVFKDSARIYIVNEDSSELQEVKTITPFAGVCCIEGLDGDRFVCTVELPLDSMVVRSRSERYLMDQTRGPLETLLNIHAATEPSSNLIVVGSNSCHTLYVYGIVDEQLEKLHDINLPKEERPKGVTIHNQEALLMMAKLPEEERQVLSLPRSEFVEYEVVLQSIPLSAQPQGACTLQSLLGQAAAKSSASLDSAVSDPIARYSKTPQGPASTASSSHLLAGAGELNRCDPAATMTWPRGLLGDLKSHLQASTAPPPRPSSSATSESHLAHRAQARRSVRVPHG